MKYPEGVKDHLTKEWCVVARARAKRVTLVRPITFDILVAD